MSSVATFRSSRSSRRGDEITLGFDGSRKRSDATTDASAIVACRVSDGHLFIPMHEERDTIWEPSPPPLDRDWEAPSSEIDAAMRSVLERYSVVAVYADPTYWESWVAGWERDFGRDVRIKLSAAHPFTWYPGPKRLVEAVMRLRTAIAKRECSIDGNATLVRHFLNAMARESPPYGVTFSKEHPASSRKVDAAMGAVLAWAARLDAMALSER